MWFHHILNMFPHYLGEVKRSNLLQSATYKLKNCITFDKKWNFKVTGQLKRQSDWNIITIARNVHPSQPHKSEDVDATVWLRYRSRAGRAFPFLSYALSQLVHILDFPAVKPAAEEGPIFCNRPGWGLDYLEARVTAGWSLVSRAWADRKSHFVNNKLWRNFWRHHLQRIFSTPHILKQPINSINTTL